MFRKCPYPLDIWSGNSFWSKIISGICFKLSHCKFKTFGRYIYHLECFRVMWSQLGYRHKQVSTRPGHMCVCSGLWNAGLWFGHAHLRFPWDAPRIRTLTAIHQPQGAHLQPDGTGPKEILGVVCSPPSFPSSRLCLAETGTPISVRKPIEDCFLFSG